ncbi:MAG: hypothetical protein JW384_01363 [Nitrosomonadaceae bacterium]|nr:hypothetical protein [Nitrosomonadaceae bacterium]
MIKAQYTPGSRVGNHMMQYASLYSLAKRLDYQLTIPPIEGFRNTFEPPAGGRAFDTPNSPLVIESRHFLHYETIDPHTGRTIVNHECSYFENIYNFHDRRNELVSIFTLPPHSLASYAFYRLRAGTLRPTRLTSISPRDIVISLRLGDFLFVPNATPRWKQRVYSRFLGFEYFEIILRAARFGRLFITSDEPFHPLVSAFQKYDPILVRNDSPIKTMAFINRFNRIAISESTYSWWAAYLTDAEEIYYPISKSGLWGINTSWNPHRRAWETINSLHEEDKDAYLRVDDERYLYVHQATEVIYKYDDAPGKRRRDNFS